VEIGAGTGSTFPHYPPAVTSVIAVEPDARSRAVASRGASTARVPIEVIGACAEALPLDDGAVDAAVAALALCSISDVPRALAELRRVLRPGGELRFLEHVLADRGPLRLLQRLAAPLYARLPEGCHIARDTLASIKDAGFSIESCECFRRSDGSFEPPLPHVLGTAWTPGGLRSGLTG
jgi:ubiquinone/menaquinone biosynthesis C-methylase UbiE